MTMQSMTLLIFHIRTARLKARLAATAEAEALLHDFTPQNQPGGPLSGQRGVFWLTVDTEDMDDLAQRLPRLGYSEAVDVLVSASGKNAGTVKWRGGHYTITRLYQEDPEIARESAPDRREFALETGDGAVRLVKGYRGDGGQLSKRGLPVYDSRLLVNLVTPFVPSGGFQIRPYKLLEPFAGVGGIALEAVASGYHVLSGDIDPVVRYGIARMGAFHSVLDAAALPFADESINAVATEPPYDPDALPTVIESLYEMARVLIPGGKIAVLVAESQAAALRDEGQNLNLKSFLDLPIDRKGLPCVVFGWQK